MLSPSQSRKFFRLPLAQKMIAAHPEQPNPHRGFSHVGLEHISGISGFEKGILSGAQVEDVKVCHHHNEKQREKALILL